MEKKVLFDWDQPYVSGSGAIKKGIKLIIYGVAKVLNLPGFMPKEIVRESDDYAEIILKINDMYGVETVIGITDSVKEARMDTVTKMIAAGYDVRRHIHIGEPPDPNRQRLWEPPLHQLPHTWHYDEDYRKGKHIKLEPGELPIWHFDRPHGIKDYINFLYNEFYTPVKKVD